MKKYNEHIIYINAPARQALQMLDSLPDGESRTLFVISGEGQLVGSLTDGDIRRGLLKDKEITDEVSLYMNRNFRYLLDKDLDSANFNVLKEQDINLVPIVNEARQIIRVIDLKDLRTVIPASVLLMAGGKGERLKPLTDNCPKPLLKIGDKPILEHNINRLRKYGITNFYISVKYLSEQIKAYFGDGSSRNISITYIEEDEPLGTIGALSLIDTIPHEHILVMNSDILTNIDIEDFFQYYIRQNVLMCMASIPYSVKIPYGVLELKENYQIASLKEKPTYTYYSNAGIYMLNKEARKYIPVNAHFNATDLMDALILDDRSVVHYPILNYWLDIGKHEDFLKAQEDIKHLKHLL